MSTRYVWQVVKGEPRESSREEMKDANTYGEENANRIASSSSGYTLKIYLSKTFNVKFEGINGNEPIPILQYDDTDRYRDSLTVPAGNYFQTQYERSGSERDDTLYYAKTSCDFNEYVDNSLSTTYYDAQLTSGECERIEFSVASTSQVLETLVRSSSSAYKKETYYENGIYKIRSYKGSDSIDPSKVEYSEQSPEHGTTITINIQEGNIRFGGTITYQYEYSLDGGKQWNFLKSTTDLSVTYDIPLNTTQFRARVRAHDDYGFVSNTWVIGTNIKVIVNNAPTISGSDSNLGSFAMTPPPAWKYTVNDADAGNTITVTEAVDGVTKRTFTATRGQQYSLGWTADEWMQVLNGTHTATITANDGQGGTATRTLTFSKSVTRIEFYLDLPLETDTMPTKALENVVRAIPAGATFRIEICNNGFDVAPTWEDVTAKVISGDKIFLRNITKTAAKWGYGIHVVIERNGASGECWVSSGAGFFE